MADRETNLKLNLKVDPSALQRAQAELGTIVDQLGKPIKLQIGAKPLPHEISRAEWDEFVKQAGGSEDFAFKLLTFGKTSGAKFHNSEGTPLDIAYGKKFAVPDPLTEAERRAAQAVDELNLGFDKQVRLLARLKISLDPEMLKRRVSLMQEERLAQFELNDALKKELELQGDIAQRAITDDERRLAALKKVNQGLEQQKQTLADLDARSNPATMRQRVENSLKIEEKQRGLNFSEAAERAKHLGPGRAFLDLFNIPEVSGRLAAFGGKLSGLGELLANPMSKASGTIGSMFGKTAGSLAAGAGGLMGKAGSMLASAAGGPIGIALAVAPLAAKAIAQLAAAPFNAVVAGMTGVNTALKGLLGPLGPIGSALHVAAGAFENVAAGFKKIPIIGQFMAIVPEAMANVFKQINVFLETSVSLVAKARPGEIKRLKFALDDTAAVVGHRLTPLVELLRHAIRAIGDVLQTVLPDTAEFRDALSPLHDAIEDIKEALAPVSRTLKIVLTESLHALGVGLRVASEIFGFLTKLAQVFSPLLLLGGGSLESSVGAAARQASIMSPESYAQSVYTAAASSGADPVRRTAHNTGLMVGLLQQILGRNSMDAAVSATAAAAAARSSWLGTLGNAAFVGGRLLGY